MNKFKSFETIKTRFFQAVFVSFIAPKALFFVLLLCCTKSQITIAKQIKAPIRKMCPMIAKIEAILEVLEDSFTSDDALVVAPTSASVEAVLRVTFGFVFVERTSIGSLSKL